MSLSIELSTNKNVPSTQALRDIEDHEIPFKFTGVSPYGTTNATIHGDYDTGYVINSTTCPGFEFK